MTQTPNPAAGRVTRIIGTVLTVLVGAPFLLFGWMAVSSRFGWGNADPHGYGLIFGTFLALLAGLLLAFVVPMMFRPGKRGTAYLGSLLAYAVVAVTMFLLLITA
jgi:hypothetical protein